MHNTHFTLLALMLVVSISGGLSPAVLAPARQRTAAPAGTTVKMVAAANAFLATLNDTEKSKVSFGFASEQRTGWSNLPSGIFERKGLRLGDLSEPQRTAAMALVAAALSPGGYKKVNDIMNGDEVLENRGGGRTGGRQGAPGGAPGGRGGRGGGIQFGRDEYYLGLLGTPSATTPWLIQFGGHHLAINVTVVGSNSALTPSLPAAQPATYTLNGETIRPLGKENDKGFALINALTADQQKHAILSYEVKDLVLPPGADGKVIQPEGIRASALTPPQQQQLLDLAHEWVGILNDEAADAKMAELKSNIGQTWFAWSGATKNGGIAYYRIQGPTMVIEYAPQQGDVEHIHTMYRDPANDYGARFAGK